MKNPSRHWLAISVALCLVLSSCSARQNNLPEDWYMNQQSAAQAAPNPEFHASKSANSRVEQVFQTHSQLMDQMVPTEMTPDSPASIKGKPIDWVPWHLHGLIASFGISADGVLGSLLLSGNPTLKGIWVRADLPTPPEVPRSPAVPTLTIHHIPRGIDLTKQLEPAIRAAIRSGVVHDEGRLRKTLSQAMRKFTTIARAIQETRFSSGWRVASYRMDVNVNASGDITPLTSVGGALNFRLDWDLPKSEGNDQNAPLDAGSLASLRPSPPLETNMKTFLQAMSEEIQLAESETDHDEDAKEMEMRDVEIFIGASEKGEIGIAEEQASVTGSVRFVKDDSATSNDHSTLSSSPDPHRMDDLAIKLIGSSRDNLSQTLASRIGTPFNHVALLSADTSSASSLDGVVYRLKRESFRNGLIRSIRMGRYFGRMAEETRGKYWKLAELETEFDVSVGGSFGLATVQGLGSVDLGFYPKSQDRYGDPDGDGGC